MKFNLHSMFILVIQFIVSNASAQTQHFSIVEPDITKPSVNYSNIRFNTGDTVIIQAGGCCQTGGSGNTWKRYVDPSGSKSDRYYHGLISIPGITNGLERIGNYLNYNYIIPDGYSGTLQLGYEDDNYSDNGYYSPDPGTENQCAGQPHAFIDVTVKRFQKAQESANQQTPPKQEGTTNPLTSSSSTSNPVSTMPDHSGGQSNSSNNPNAKLAFFQTLPGILTGIAAVITAIVALFQIFKSKK